MLIRTAAAAAALALLLAGCGSSDDESAGDPTPSQTATPTTTPSPEPTSEPEPESSPEVRTVVVSIAGDTIKPNGERLQVARGEIVLLEVTSDRAGELHVHSKPEQYVEFPEGTSTYELVIEAPGLVDVEEHDTGHIVVQLEVS